MIGPSYCPRRFPSESARRHPDSEGDIQGPRRLRDRPELCQEGALDRCPQSIQAPHRVTPSVRDGALTKHDMIRSKLAARNEVGASVLLIAFISRPDVGLIPCGCTQKERPPALPQA